MNTCPVCEHAEMAAIENELRAGQPMPSVARRYGVDWVRLAHHWEAHSVPDREAPAEAAEGAAALDDMLRLLAVSCRMGTGGLRLVQRRERTVTRDQRHAGGEPPPSIEQSPDWQRLRAKVLLTLERYPEAYEALVRALSE